MEFKEEYYTAEIEMPLLQLLLEHYRPYRAKELIRNNLVLVNDRVVSRKSFIVVPGDRIMANVPQGKALDPVPEDIPVLVEKLGIGSGKRAGFMELDRNDVTEIYRIAAHASL